MAHILARMRGSGVRYTANIRIKKNGVIVHRESKTFELRSAAEKWAKAREVDLENPTALIKAANGAATLANLIRWYIESFKHIANWQRTKQTTLEFLERHEIGESNALQLTTAILIDHIRNRRASGAGPATAGNDLTWIGCVLKAAKSVQGLPVEPRIVEEARTACRELRLIGKAKRRDRRPTDAELATLFDFFGRRDQRSDIPMCDVTEFAIESSRREAEITRLEWDDLDEKTRTGLVRNAKHPRAKDGNHRRFRMTPEAWAIIRRQPRISPYIFPYNPRSIQAAFTRACQILGIVDYHFHDNRHEATSRLFERGYEIHEVALFTLHESWNDLKRYANLRPGKVRELSASNIQPVRPSAGGSVALAVSRPGPVGRRSRRRGPSRSPTMGTSGRPV
jgi:integrase